MKCKPLKSALAIFGIAVAIFLSCSDHPILEFLSSEDVQGHPSSSGEASSSSDYSSSSGEADSSSSAESSSSGEAGSPSSSSGEASSSSCDEADKCGGKCYNRETHFCINKTTPYELCSGEEYVVVSQSCCGGTIYNLSSYGCKNNAVLTKCGAEDLYNPLEQFCASDGKAYFLCGGRQFDPASQVCTLKDGKDVIIGNCGAVPNLDYNTHFCYNATPYELCGGTLQYDPGTQECCGSSKYTIATQFCHTDNTIKNKCGGTVQYDPGTEECCGGSKYTIATQCCHTDNTIKNKCGGTVQYDPGTEECCGGSKYTIATQFCYDNSSSKIGNFCGINPQKDYDPDLYECKPSSNGIYLKTGITDSRNSKTYKAVLIGEQTWMAENLNYNAGNSKCYSNSEANCNTYGRLYKWATAMNINQSYNSASFTASAKHQGICPTGWHISSNAEWTTLINYVGASTAGTKLKAASGWGNIPGTDDYGFSALPSGACNTVSQGFFDNGRSTSFLSATEGSASAFDYWCIGIPCGQGVAAFATDTNGKSFILIPVRCVKD